jgi:hypothetical protein
MGFRSVIADEVAELIGEEATAILCDAFPGVPLYVAARPTPRLVELIGLEKATLLCSCYRGCCMVLPRLVSARAASKHNQLRDDRKFGLSASQLARKYGYSVRHVWNVLSGVDEPDQNMSFDF